jgi:hypothetical protein
MTLLSWRESRTRDKGACQGRTECAAKRASSLDALPPGARITRGKGMWMPSVCDSVRKLSVVLEGSYT